MQTLLAKHWHHLPIDEVVAVLETDLDRGLDLFDIKHRQERFGPNVLTARKGKSPDDILQGIVDLPEEILDQWEAQSYAYLMKVYDIRLFSAMDRAQVRACKLGAVSDFESEVEAAIRKLGKHPTVGVLPDGPLTIPYLSGK